MADAGTLKELDLEMGDLVIVRSHWMTGEWTSDSVPLIFIRRITEFVTSSMFDGCIMMDPHGRQRYYESWVPVKIVSRTKEAYG